MKVKKKIIILSFLFTALVAYGKPMTSSVDSWEGSFRISKSNIPILAEGLPPLNLWLYELESGSKGTCIGFSRENGDMILKPKPNEKGVQPIYTGYSVLFVENGMVEIIVTYDVQGNGRMEWVEKYLYDGKQIELISSSQFFGKYEPVWKNIESE